MTQRWNSYRERRRTRDRQREMGKGEHQENGRMGKRIGMEERGRERKGKEGEGRRMGMERGNEE